jgi:hypothetical protein
MCPQELLYYRARARGERHRSANARTKAAAEIHLRLAVLYEKLVDLETANPCGLTINEVGPLDCHSK